MAAQQPHLGHVDVICRISGGGVIAAENGKQLPRLASSREQLQPSQAAFLEGHETVVIATPNVEQVLTPLTSQQHSTVPINDLSTPLSVDTPIFSGTALLCLRHMPNTPKGVFEGKRRQMVLTVQGRFKQPNVPLDSLVLGSEFARPLKLPAGPLISSTITWLAQKLGGGVSVNVGGKDPHILAPLIAAAQVINVSLPGQAPDLQAPAEDLRLFDKGLVSSWTGKPMSSKQRRAHFSSGNSRKGRCYDTDHVWTFQVYEHIMDYSTFLLNMPLLHFDMVQVFDGQPLQLMMKDLSSSHSMLHLTVWHRRMLTHTPSPRKRTHSPRVSRHTQSPRVSRGTQSPRAHHGWSPFHPSRASACSEDAAAADS